MKSSGPSAGGGRLRADIQGMRALAVLVVVAFHAGLGLPGGFVGVDVFFVISGYVITAMLVSDHSRSGRFNLGRFYLRRMRRLLPAMAVVLMSVLVMAPMIGPHNGAEATVQTARAGALFTANLQLLFEPAGYFAPSSDLNAGLHLWTLSVEEQFYLGFPLLLVVAGWATRRFRRDPDRGGAVTGVARMVPSPVASRLTLAIVGAVALASFVMAWQIPEAGGEMLGLHGIAPRLVFFSAPTRAWEFLVGALLALVHVRSRGSVNPSGGAPQRRTRFDATTSANAWGVVGLALMAWAVLAFDEGTPFPHVAGVVPVAAAVALIAGGVGGNGLVSRALAAEPVRWVGDRSYGWYLWHWPRIVFAAALLPGSSWARPAGAVVALAPTALMYRYVEQPIRRGEPVVSRTLALGCACVAAPLLLSIGFMPTVERIDESSRITDSGAGPYSHLDSARGCDDSVVRSRSDCTWFAGRTGSGGSDQPGGPEGRGQGRNHQAVLLGDSNAGHFAEGFIDAAHSLSLDAVVQTRHGCPFADVEVRRNGGPDAACGAFYERQMNALVENPPEIVVLATASDLHASNAEYAFRVDGQRWAESRSEKLGVWQVGLRRTLEDLVALGVGVVILEPVPRFTNWGGIGVCARLTLIVDPARCGNVRPTDQTSPVGEGAVQADLAATADLGRVTLVDPRPILCPSETCATRQDGVWVQWDYAHLTVQGSRRLTPDIAKGMREVLAP